MEEYLENLKSFRSYMKDAEDEAAKRSAEEQRQITAIEALENDLDLVRSEIAKVSAETAEMLIEKSKVDCEINEKQNKVASLETESSTLKQTLELLHQEINTITEKLSAERSIYTNTIENFVAQLKDQEEWITKQVSSQDGLLQVQGSLSKESNIEGGYRSVNEGKLEDMKIKNCEKEKSLKLQMELTKQQMETLEAKRTTLNSETLQNKELLDQEKQLMKAMPHNLVEMEVNGLEEGQKAILSDKTGEAEYIQSLQGRITVLKGVSCGVTCRCGVQYEVTLKGRAKHL